MILLFGSRFDQKAEAARNGQSETRGARFVVRNSTELPGSAGLRLVKGFHGREFGRLKFRDRTRTEIAADQLQRSTGAGERERHAQCVAMKRISAIAQKEEGMNRSHGKSGRDKRRQSHVQNFMSGRGIQHRRDRIDVGDLAIDNLETGRRIHPRVGRHDEDAGRNSAQDHEHAAEPMHQRRQTLPPHQIQAEENRLGEKRETLERKRHPDDRARFFHEAWPQQTELKREHRS